MPTTGPTHEKEQQAALDAAGLLDTNQGEAITQAQTEVDAAEVVNTTQATSIANLNAWATALATKLNLDATVTDTDYDTDPQA